MIDTDKYEGHTEGAWIWHDWFASECESSCRLSYVVGHEPKGMIITECSLEKQFEKGDAYDYFGYKAIVGEGANEADIKLIADAPLLLKEVKNQNYQLHLYQSALRQMQEDTLKVVTEWFDVYGGDENEWRRLEQALGLPLTPLSWEGGEVKRLREGRLDLINEVVRIINNKTGERVDADLHDYIIDRLVNE